MEENNISVREQEFKGLLDSWAIGDAYNFIMDDENSDLLARLELELITQSHHKFALYNHLKGRDDFLFDEGPVTEYLYRLLENNPHLNLEDPELLEKDYSVSLDKLKADYHTHRTDKLQLKYWNTPPNTN